VDRRTFLAVAAGIGLSGCVAESAPMGSPETRASRTDALSRSKPVRCRGEPVAAETSLTDASGYDDGFRYFPANDTVRVVTAEDSDGPALFETSSFEEWASIQCAQVGLRRVREATVTRLGTGEFNSAIGDSPGFFSSDSSVVRLDVATYLQANGTDTTPTTSLSRLVRDAPRSVDAAVSLEDETFSRTIPVFAEHLRIEAR
jgi:hypothetical protein